MASQSFTPLHDLGKQAPRRRRGRPARLSRLKILTAALAIVDNEGAEALTMRRLGAELGVEAMSLYRYVANKDAVLDGISEVMMAQLAMPRSRDRSWPTVARSFAGDIRRIALAHPRAFEQVGMRSLSTLEALSPIEALLATLRDEGFSPAQAVVAYRLLSGYASGYALAEIRDFAFAPPSVDGNRPLIAEHLPGEHFPTALALAPHLGGDGNGKRMFRAGLDVIIAGLEQTRSGTRTAAKR